MLAGLDAIGGFVTGGGASGSFMATVDFPTITKTQGTSGGGGTVTTTTVTVTASGGLAPYAYSWANISGSGVLANSPTAAATKFHESLGADDSDSATMRCTVTDSGGSHTTVDVDVTLTMVGA